MQQEEGQETRKVGRTEGRKKEERKEQGKKIRKLHIYFSSKYIYNRKKKLIEKL